MKRRLDPNIMAEWRTSVGGLNQATDLIQKKLKCGFSKADKIASGTYPSVPSPLELDALSSLMKKSVDVIYPLACKPKGRAS